MSLLLSCSVGEYDETQSSRANASRRHWSDAIGEASEVQVGTWAEGRHWRDAGARSTGGAAWILLPLTTPRIYPKQSALFHVLLVAAFRVAAYIL